MAGSEGREPLEDFASLRRELKLYDPTLADRPSLIVANKMDLEGADAKLKAFKAKHRKFKILPASAKLKDGIEVVREAIASLVF
jgi:GTP-binding protein